MPSGHPHRLIRIRVVMEFEGRPVETATYEAPRGSGKALSIAMEGCSALVRDGEKDRRGLGPGDDLVTIRLGPAGKDLRTDVSDEEIMRRAGDRFA